MKLKALVGSLALLGLASHALAQADQRVTITGSSIKRVQAEGALPVQTVSREEIERLGIVSAEQLVMRLTANGTGADNLSSNVGIQLGTSDRNNNGNSSANLRGLGSNSTLVLLNGRRVPPHGAKGNSVDLNFIPLAAIERVEVLKDGASAVYGTDAIGGVINFILRRDYTGLEATAFVDITEQGGGNIYRGSVLGGMGDITKDGYNLMASLTYDKQARLGGYGERAFANGFQPERGLSPDTTGTPFATQTGAANTALGSTYTLPATGTQTYNRANLLSFQGRCGIIPLQSQYQSALWGSPGFANGCAFDYGGSAVLIQPVERVNLLARASLALGTDHSLFGEFTGSQTKATKEFEPYQITTTGGLAGSQYPVGGPYYQDLSAFIPSFNPTRPIAYRWRCTICGNRTIETTTDAWRLLVGAEGTIGAWDYRSGLSIANSKATSLLVAGYYYTNADPNNSARPNGLNSVLGSGVVNPWLLPGQTQTQAAIDAMALASAAGSRLFAGKSTTTQFDVTASRDLFKLGGGMLAVAAGVDVRQETYRFSDGSVTTRAINAAPFDPEFPKVKRDITAVFGEVVAPLFKGFEASLALRSDRYSDFGSTTNPKVSFKYTPVEQLLLRGSFNEGFRAPSFFQLFTQTTESQIPGNIADPDLCPGGNVPGADLTVCAIRPNARQGGNPGLKPETSEQWTLGFVASPADWVSFSVDLWEVKRTNLIYELTAQQVVANYTTFPGNLVRGAGGRLDGLGGYIRAGFVNADGDITRGVDVNVSLNGKVAGMRWLVNLDGTYLDSHRSRIFSNQPYVESVGQWDSRDLFVRWKHQLRGTLTSGPWSGTITQGFTKGYKDEVPVGTVPPGFNPDVKDYITYDLSVSYTGIKNLTITGGVKNLLDTDPPFTAHNLDFAAGAGWDPRVADPRGRAYTLRVNYKFF
jgi:iron complex outermembrane recepter protein